MKDLAIDRMNAERDPEYFVSRITSGEYVRHNKLEEAVEVEAGKYDRWIIPVAGINDFKTQFKNRIDELNAEHPRCKPIELDIWTLNSHFKEGIDRHDIQFNFSMNLSLTLFAVKGYPKHSQVDGNMIVF